MIEKNKINEIINKIVSSYHPDKIILFGSYANGNPTENSDIDLLIFKDSELPRPDRGIELRKLLFGSKIPMDILIYTNQELSESMKNKYNFVYQAIKNGKVLYERKNSI